METLEQVSLILIFLLLVLLNGVLLPLLATGCVGEVGSGCYAGSV